MTTPIEIVIQGRDNTGGAFASAGGALSKFGSVANGVFSVASTVIKTLGTALAGGTVALAGFGYTSFLAAAQVDELKVVNEVLAKNAGLSLEAVRKEAAEVKGMGIESAVAEKAVAEFIKANLNLGQASDIARIAQDAAVISQTNSSESFGAILEGITKLNPEILRTQGIMVDSKTAFDAYAETIGKDADELTAAEKQQAFMNAVMEQGTKIAGSYEAAMKEPGKVLRSFPRYFNDIAVSVGGQFKASFGTAVFAVSGLLKGLGKAVEEGGAFYPVIQKLSGAMEPLIKAFSDFIVGIDFNQIADKIIPVIDFITSFSSNLPSLFSNIGEEIKKIDFMKWIQAALGGVSMAGIFTTLAAGLATAGAAAAPLLGAGISSVLWRGWLLAIPKLAGPLTSLLSTKFGSIFLGGISKAIPFFGKLSGFASLLTPLAGVLSSIVIPLALITGAVLLAVGAFNLFKQGKLDQYLAPLISAFNLVKTNIMLMMPTLQAVGKSIAEHFIKKAQELAEKVIPFVVQQVQKFSVWLTENRPLIEAFAVAVGKFINGFIDAVVGFWDVIQPLLGGVIDLILELVTFVMQIATGDWAGAWETIKEMAKTVWVALKAFVLAALNWIANLMGSSLAKIKTQWSNNWTQLKLIVTTIWNNIKTAIATKIAEIKTSIDNKMTEIKTSITTKWNEIKTAISTKLIEIVTNITTKFIEMKTNITNKLTEIKTNVIAKWLEIVNAIKTKLAEIITNIVTWGLELKTKITEKIQEAIDAVRTKIAEWVDIGKEIIQNIIKGLQENFQSLVDWLTDLITDLITGVFGGGGAGLLGNLGMNITHNVNPSAGGFMAGGGAGGFTGGGVSSLTTNRATTNYYNAHITVYTGKVDPKKSMRGFI